VVLIPLLRSIPAFYRWRIRARMYRRYRALLSLERELFKESDPGKREQLLKQLDEIESTVNRMKVPAFIADQFYGLRGHIGFVRQIVGDTRPRPIVGKPLVWWISQARGSSGTETTCISIPGAQTITCRLMKGKSA
jgi:hypothetical protein